MLGGAKRQLLQGVQTEGPALSSTEPAFFTGFFSLRGGLLPPRKERGAEERRRRVREPFGPSRPHTYLCGPRTVLSNLAFFGSVPEGQDTSRGHICLPASNLLLDSLHLVRPVHFTTPYYPYSPLKSRAHGAWSSLEAARRQGAARGSAAAHASISSRLIVFLPHLLRIARAGIFFQLDINVVCTWIM